MLRGGMTERDADPLVTREILRAELNRALMIQTVVFAGIVAAIVALAMSL